MLKKCGVWLAGIVFVATVVFMAYEQHYAREKYQAQAQTDCVALAVSIEEKHTCAKEAQGRKEYAPWWHVLVTWPEGITTWAIIATGFVIAWQSSETRKAAKAALLNAQAVIDAERAWLVVKIQNDSNSPPFPIENFINVLTNEGRTPAVLRSIHIEHTFVSLPDDLPVPPVYGPRWSVSIPENTFVVGRDDLRIGIPLTPDKAIFSHRNPKRAGDTQEFFVWYGRVIYEDIFGTKGANPQELHETRWCYAWIAGEKKFVRCGPEGYNRNT